MIRNLSATVDRDDLDIAGIKQMLFCTGSPEGKNRGMFNAPDLVGAVSGALLGKGLHGLEYRQVIIQAKLPYN